MAAGIRRPEDKSRQMNYRHAYHAGNFGDVLKHVVLMLCLDHLKRKETPFRVIDTHAGAGRYRLNHSAAAKTDEWRSGIGRLMGPDASSLPPKVEQRLMSYLAAVRAENPDGVMNVYPGSPALVQTAIRPGDAFVANELHPEDAAILKAVLALDKLCKMSNLDGYAALKALLPPKERRGLVLVDPPFEQPGELIRMTESLGDAIKRFATGIYLLWYPIKDDKPINRFYRGILEVTTAAGLPPPLRVELLLRPLRNPLLLNGAGLAIINPPYQLEAELDELLPKLASLLGDDGKGSHRLSIATPPDDNSASTGAAKSTHQRVRPPR